jgi:hypothetical protein
MNLNEQKRIKDRFCSARMCTLRTHSPNWLAWWRTGKKSIKNRWVKSILIVKIDGNFEVFHTYPRGVLSMFCDLLAYLQDATKTLVYRMQLNMASLVRRRVRPLVTCVTHRALTTDLYYECSPFAVPKIELALIER